MNNQPKKIVIIGPESTGKSTLTKGLAEIFGEPWVPEYVREYLLELNRPYEYQDLLAIAKGQLAEEDAKFKTVSRFLFCDTDLRVIEVWSRHKYGKTDPWITARIQERIYDYYLLTNIDIPWQHDPMREHPDPQMRKYFFEIYRKTLIKSGIPFTIISGNEEERMEKAVTLIKKIASY